MSISLLFNSDCLSFFLIRPIPFSIGVGLLYTATTFPVLAPLPPSLAGQALAFMVFVRNFGNILGITVGKSSPRTLQGEPTAIDTWNTQAPPRSQMSSARSSQRRFWSKCRVVWRVHIALFHISPICEEHFRSCGWVNVC